MRKILVWERIAAGKVKSHTQIKLDNVLEASTLK